MTDCMDASIGEVHPGHAHVIVDPEATEPGHQVIAWCEGVTA